MQVCEKIVEFQNAAKNENKDELIESVAFFTWRKLIDLYFTNAK